MLNLLESSRSAAMISASILVAAAILGAAQAATDTIYRYSTPKTGFLGIDNMALIPDSDNALAYQNNWDTGLRPRMGENGCFNAGVHLPHGAIIARLVVFYRSAADATVPRAYLLRKEFSTGTSQQVGFSALPDAATRTSYDVSLDDALATVNNSRYSYGFGICLENSGDTFYAARIVYTYEHAGD
jgi:hypothetical protein